MSRKRSRTKLAGRHEVAGQRTAVSADQQGRQRQTRSKARVALLAVALLALLATFLWRGGPSRVTNHFAARAIARHDLASARSWLQWSRQWSARNPETLFLAARIARREGDLPEMSRYLGRASQLGGATDRIERERVLGQVQAGQLEPVQSRINHWLSQGDPEAAEISNAYANGLAANSRFDAALRVLAAWHQDFPNDPLPLYRIGRIHEHLDQIDEAEASYRAAVAADPQHYASLYSLGRLLRDQKQAAEASDFFQRALSMPRPAAAMVGLAQCLIETGETARAAELLRRVLKLERDVIRASYQSVGERPERFLAAAELGKLEANRGNYAEAKRWLDAALEENPRDLSARYSRALVLRGLGQLDLAEAEFERVQETKKELEKVNILRNRIKRDPRDTAARIELAKLLIAYESKRSGLFWLRSVLSYDPDHAEVRRLLDMHRSSAANDPLVGLPESAEAPRKPISPSAG